MVTCVVLSCSTGCQVVKWEQGSELPVYALLFRQEVLGPYPPTISPTTSIVPALILRYCCLHYLWYSAAIPLRCFLRHLSHRLPFHLRYCLRHTRY